MRAPRTAEQQHQQDKRGIVRERLQLQLRVVAVGVAVALAVAVAVARSLPLEFQLRHTGWSCRNGGTIAC
eukprot:8412235-Alexandrium_andersonii.AAC.1